MFSKYNQLAPVRRPYLPPKMQRAASRRTAPL